MIEDGRIVLGGNANRNHLGFEEKFNKIIRDVEAGVESRTQTQS